MADHDDTHSATAAETRMLERRVSNNRSDLDGDRKINYVLSWFTQWSDLQKSDFVSVLADVMSSTASVNGCAHLLDGMSGMSLDAKKPPSLFDCQVKLFREWFSCWSDDQKNYLVLRLKDIDANFFLRYENRLQSGGRTPGEKDYFEPGVPAHLVMPVAPCSASVHAKLVTAELDEEDEGEEQAPSAEPVGS